jgi:hypothetical protein
MQNNRSLWSRQHDWSVKNYILRLSQKSMEKGQYLKRFVAASRCPRPWPCSGTSSRSCVTSRTPSARTSCSRTGIRRACRPCEFVHAPGNRVGCMSNRNRSEAGANPIVVCYNATSSLARFENKNILFCLEKRSGLLQLWRCSYKFRSRRLAPALKNIN